MFLRCHKNPLFLCVRKTSLNRLVNLAINFYSFSKMSPYGTLSQHERISRISSRYVEEPSSNPSTSNHDFRFPTVAPRVHRNRLPVLQLLYGIVYRFMDSWFLHVQRFTKYLHQTVHTRCLRVGSVAETTCITKAFRICKNRCVVRHFLFFLSYNKK